LIGVALHELTHALGRVAGLQQGGPNDFTPQDLFHYTAPGSLQLSEGSNPGYFSIDGGITNLDNFDATNHDGDWTRGIADSFSAFGGFGSLLAFTQTDVTTMDVLDGPSIRPLCSQAKSC
jgi:hypothetical protein